MVSDKARKRILGLRDENQKLLVEFLEKERLSPKSEEVYVHSVQGFEKATNENISNASQDILFDWFSGLNQSQDTQILQHTSMLQD